MNQIIILKLLKMDTDYWKSFSRLLPIKISNSLQITLSSLLSPEPNAGITGY